MCLIHTFLHCFISLVYIYMCVYLCIYCSYKPFESHKNLSRTGFPKRRTRTFVVRPVVQKSVWETVGKCVFLAAVFEKRFCQNVFSLSCQGHYTSEMPNIFEVKLVWFFLRGEACDTSLLQVSKCKHFKCVQHQFNRKKIVWQRCDIGHTGGWKDVTILLVYLIYIVMFRSGLCVVLRIPFRQVVTPYIYISIKNVCWFFSLHIY